MAQIYDILVKTDTRLLRATNERERDPAHISVSGARSCVMCIVGSPYYCVGCAKVLSESETETFTRMTLGTLRKLVQLKL